MPPFRKKRFNSKRPTLPKLAEGEFDLEKARHEVFMLGIKGLGKKDKKQAKQELAIRLGAVPKKPRGKNPARYLADLREQKRKEKEEREERARTGDNESMVKNKTKKPAQKLKKKGLNEVRDMDYQIGRFKNGVQYLNKDDILKLKRKGR